MIPQNQPEAERQECAKAERQGCVMTVRQRPVLFRELKTLNVCPSEDKESTRPQMKFNKEREAGTYNKPIQQEETIVDKKKKQKNAEAILRQERGNY